MKQSINHFLYPLIMFFLILTEVKKKIRPLEPELVGNAVIYTFIEGSDTYRISLEYTQQEKGLFFSCRLIAGGKDQVVIDMLELADGRSFRAEVFHEHKETAEYPFLVSLCQKVSSKFDDLVYHSEMLGGPIQTVNYLSTALFLLVKTNRIDAEEMADAMEQYVRPFIRHFLVKPAA